jgi:hypothetical protein
MTSISSTLTRKQTFPRVPNAYSFPRSSPHASKEPSHDPEYRSRTPSPLENSVTAEYGEGVRTVAAPAAVIPPTIGTPSITSAEDAKSPNGVIFPPMVGNVEDNRFPTPPAASTACSILLCIHSAQMRTAKNYRVAVFRSHPNVENTTDKDLFLEFKRTYNVELRSFWQRFFSLRGLKYIGVVEVCTSKMIWIKKSMPCSHLPVHTTWISSSFTARCSLTKLYSPRIQKTS